MRKDWDGTLKAMKDFGYSYIDLNQVSPFIDRPAADLKASFTAHGFTFSNALWSYQAFANRFDQTVADSLTLGLKTIVCSPRPRLRTSDDWKSMADELNKYGERTKAAGLTLGYHNHEIEFVKTPQGDVPWDILVQSTDPSLVRFLIDVGNCAFGGGDPVRVPGQVRDPLLRRPRQGPQAGQGGGPGRRRRSRLEADLHARQSRQHPQHRRRSRRVRREHAAGPAARPARLQRARAVQAQRGVSAARFRAV